MGTNCAPRVADLFLFCYESDAMKSLTEEKQYDMIDAFNSTSRYRDDLLNIDNICSGSTASVGEDKAVFFCYCLHVILWFLFRGGFSSSWYLGWAELFYCGTPWAFH